MLNRLVLGIALLFVSANVGRADFIPLSDIQVWVGSGSNEAGFVVDWNNGVSNVSLAWGYRWDGTATGEDMLRALAGSNTGLYANLGYFGPGLGYAVFGLGVHLDQNGTFGVSPPLSFVSGISTLNGTTGLNEARQPTDSGDLYQEGWFSAGYWSYWTKNSSTDAWQYSPVGMSSSVLTNGNWQGWSFAPNFAGSAPVDPVPAILPGGGGGSSPVPGPSAVVLLFTSAPVVLMFVRRRPAPLEKV